MNIRGILEFNLKKGSYPVPQIEVKFSNLLKGGFQTLHVEVRTLPSLKSILKTSPSNSGPAFLSLRVSSFAVSSTSSFCFTKENYLKYPATPCAYVQFKHA